MTDPQTVLATWLASYADAAWRRDIDAFCALYAQDVRLFDMWGQWQIDGLTAWRAAVEDWFGALAAGERVRVTFDATHGAGSADLVIGHAFVTYAAISSDGSNPRSMGNRLTVALRSAQGAWQAIHEHTSAPIDHASLKAILVR